jgi:MFS family permease
MTQYSVTHPSKYPTALTILFVVQLLSMGAMEMSAPFWPLHLQALGQLSTQQLSWAISLAYAGPMVMAMLCTPIWGKMGDRIGHKPMVLRALIALTFTQLWVAVTDESITILVIRLIQGGLAGFIAAAQAYGTGLVEPKKRGKLMADLQIATAIGSAVGPLLGGWLFDHYGFQSVNWVAAIVCLICTFISWHQLPAIKPITLKTSTASPSIHSTTHLFSEHSPIPSKQRFSLIALTGFLVMISLIQAGKMMPQSFFALYSQQILQLPAWAIGMSYGASALGLCIAAPFWGKRFEQLSDKQVLRQTEIISWICVAIIIAQALSHLLLIFVLTRFLWGVCLAALLPIFYALLSRVSPLQEQGRVLGAGNSAAKAGALLGIGTGSLTLIYLPLSYAFFAVAAVYAIAALSVRFIYQRYALGGIVHH